jgi:hypothetical protein
MLPLKGWRKVRVYNPTSEPVKVSWPFSRPGDVHEQLHNYFYPQGQVYLLISRLQLRTYNRRESNSIATPGSLLSHLPLCYVAGSMTAAPSSGWTIPSSLCRLLQVCGVAHRTYDAAAATRQSSD